MADTASDRLNLLIAQGAPRVDFSPLSSLLGDYVAGKQLAQKAGSIDVFKNGAPTLADGTPDYAAMARTYYQLGDMNTGTQLANLAMQRAKLGFGDQSGAASFGSGGNPSFNIGPQAGSYPNFNVNPPFGGAPMQQSGAMPVFTTPQDLQRAGLSSGSPFMTSDGRIKRVP